MEGDAEVRSGGRVITRSDDASQLFHRLTDTTRSSPTSTVIIFCSSVDTSKPATRGRFKTGHHGVASETGGGLPRSHFLTQIGVDLGAPAAGSALEDVSMVQEAVE